MINENITLKTNRGTNHDEVSTLSKEHHGAASKDNEVMNIVLKRELNEVIPPNNTVHDFELNCAEERKHASRCLDLTLKGGAASIIMMDESGLTQAGHVKKSLIKSQENHQLCRKGASMHNDKNVNPNKEKHHVVASLEESFIFPDVSDINLNNKNTDARESSPSCSVRGIKYSDEEKGVGTRENNKQEATSSVLYMHHSLSSLFQAIHEKYQEITNSMVYQAKKIPATMKNIIRCATETRYETQLAFFSLVISYLTTIYPTLPRCNCGLALLVLGCEQLLEFTDFCSVYSFMVLYFISVCLDIDWLISDYYPATLDRDNQLFVNDMKILSMHKVADCVLAFGSTLKICALVFYLRKTEAGLQVISSIWNKTKLFLPCLLPLHMKKEKRPLQLLDSRVIAIIWLEFFSSLGILCCSIYAHLQLSWAQQFQLKESLFGVIEMTIINLFYIKGAIGFLSMLAISKNCSKRAIFAEFGCVQHTNDDVRQGVEVLINREFIIFNGVLKLLNLSIGIIAWIFLLSAWAIEGSDSLKEIKVVLLCLMCALLLTDGLATSLFVMVGCYYNMVVNGSSVLKKINHSEVISNNRITSASTDDINNNKAKFSKLFLYEKEKEDKNKWVFNQGSFSLEDDVQHEQAKFSIQWKLLHSGFKEVYRINRLPPSIKFCRNILLEHRFFLVRSKKMRNNSNMVIMYLAARCKSVDILCEMKCDSQKMCLVIQVKFDPVIAQSFENFRIVRDHLPLAKLYGEDIMSYYN